MQEVSDRAFYAEWRNKLVVDGLGPKMIPVRRIQRAGMFLLVTLYVLLRSEARDVAGQIPYEFLMVRLCSTTERWRRTTEAGIQKVLKMVKIAGGVLHHCTILVLPLLDHPVAPDAKTPENRQKWLSALEKCEYEVLDGNHRVAAWTLRYVQCCCQCLSLLSSSLATLS